MSKRRGTLAAMLSDQGFGNHKDCQRLVRNGSVELGREEGGALVWSVAEDPDAQIAPEGLHLKIGAFQLPWREKLYLAFHKPAGTECSHTPSHHQSVFSFFPEPFLKRKLEAVGRLDADTTGLLFLTDSGVFNHFLTSPRKHVPKTYRVGTKHAISPEQIAKLTEGVDLRGEDGKTLPATVALLDEKSCDLTVEEGKYHQVKRMFAAAGNRVESIHRVAIGAIKLEDALASGQWRWLNETELSALGFKEP
ncbi:MAG: Ribosomal small subunit pseudouridine synthase 4 [Fibrobacteres bacterium]|nr:Ribosomal small subunit pseudouridine synthase 4 [Fibrobacterota bacterium]